MTRDEMIEQVARAMCRRVAGDPDVMTLHPAQKSWEQPTMPRWQHWEDEAHAAILALLRAIREPTAEQIDRGDLEIGPPGVAASDLTEAYTAMIDTLLAEMEGRDAAE